MTRREELAAHVEGLAAAIEAESDSAKLTALYRERRQTLAELDALRDPNEQGQESTVDEVSKQRRKRMRDAGADDPSGSGRRRQPRRSSGRNRTS